MIDTLSIILSTLACVFVVYQAVRLDKILPRFGQAPQAPQHSASQAWTPGWAGPIAVPAIDVEAEAPPAWSPDWN